MWEGTTCRVRNVTQHCWPAGKRLVSSGKLHHLPKPLSQISHFNLTPFTTCPDGAKIILTFGWLHSGYEFMMLLCSITLEVWRGKFQCRRVNMIQGHPLTQCLPGPPPQHISIHVFCFHLNLLYALKTIQNRRFLLNTINNEVTPL